jgi:hypothetical protein
MLGVNKVLNLIRQVLLLPPLLLSRKKASMRFVPNKTADSVA